MGTPDGVQLLGSDQSPSSADQCLVQDAGGVVFTTVRTVEPLTLPSVALILVVPWLTPCASPVAAPIVATPVVADAQVTELLITAVVASEYVPVATNCWFVPVAITGLAGVTAMPCRVAEVTVRTVEPLTNPRLALMLLVPAASPVARPLEPIVAVAEVAEAQVTAAVRSRCEPSEYVPVAVNCWFAPIAITGLAGATAMLTRVAAVTVKVVLPLTLPSVALMLDVPAATPVARPVVAPMVATEPVADAQLTEPVRSAVVASEYVPVAVNCWFVPAAIDGLAGVTAMLCRVAPVTVRTVEPLMSPNVALMLLVPAATPWARPVVLMVAIELVAEAQLTEPVIMAVELSEYVPVATNCWFAPATIDGLAGVTAMLCRVAEVTVRTVEPLMSPSVALMLDVPTATPWARPVALIVALAVVPEAQVTAPVRSRCEPSLYVPVAVNCWVSPAAIEGLAGVTAMLCNVAEVTVSTVEPLMLPSVALIVDVPTATPVARPVAPTVAVAGVPEAQVTDPVRSAVELSEYVPVATNCWVSPAAIDGLAGVTAMLCNAAAVTVNTVEPLMSPTVALTLEVPTATPWARPVAPIVATELVADAQVTEPVMTAVVASEYVPVATNCWFAPATIDGLAGVTAMLCNVAEVTVSTVEPLTSPSVAVMLEVPVARPVARPLVAPMVAVAVVPEAHVTAAVRSRCEPSLYVPVAVNCCVSPAAIEGLAGVTAMLCRVAEVTVSTVEPLTRPNVAVMLDVPTATPWARPPELIVATEVVADAHVTEPVMTAVVASLYVPVAVNCWFAPATIEGFAGATAMLCTVAAVTVRTVEPLISPTVALMLLVPAATPWARPLELIVALAVVPEAHVTVAVRSRCEPSLYVPVAVNCWVSPAAIDGLAGVTAML